MGATKLLVPKHEGGGVSTQVAANDRFVPACRGRGHCTHHVLMAAAPCAQIKSDIDGQDLSKLSLPALLLERNLDGKLRREGETMALEQA